MKYMPGQTLQLSRMLKIFFLLYYMQFLVLPSLRRQEGKKATKTTSRYKDVFSGLQMKIMASVVFAPDRTWALGKVWRQGKVGRVLHLIYLKPGTISYFSLSARILIQLQTWHRCSNPLMSIKQQQLPVNLQQTFNLHSTGCSSELQGGCWHLQRKCLACGSDKV